MELKTKLIGALTTLAIAGACLAPICQAHIEHKNEQALLEKAQHRQEQLAKLVNGSENVKSYLKSVSTKYNLNETQVKVLEAVSNGHEDNIYAGNIKGYETDEAIVKAAQEYAKASDLRHLLIDFKPGTKMFEAVKNLQASTNVDMYTTIQTVLNAHSQDLENKNAEKIKYESEHKCEKLVTDIRMNGGTPGFTCG